LGNWSAKTINIRSLEKRILLDDKMKMSARIEVLDRVNQKTLLKVIIKESLNRQIRKIATLLGHPVQDLQRISISNTNSNGLQ
jgi:16S rRNA pseudouridine516 synthase